MSVIQCFQGVNRDIKQVFDQRGGVLHSVKERWEQSQGVNRLVFSSWNGELYNRGNQFNFMTGGYSITNSAHVSFQPDHVLFDIGAQYKTDQIVTNNKVSLTGYTSVKIVYLSSEVNNIIIEFIDKDTDYIYGTITTSSGGYYPEHEFTEILSIPSNSLNKNVNIRVGMTANQYPKKLLELTLLK